MKLRDEHLRSYIDDTREIGLLRFLTWRGNDVAAAWMGAHEPATRSDDAELASLAKMNRDHYLFYRALLERHCERSDSALDVGCGNGQRTAMLARYFDTVVGVDSDLSKITCGAQMNPTANVNWVGGDVRTMDADPGMRKSFDYVFAVELIEHITLDDHASFLAMLLRKVAPGGALLMTTPRDRPPQRKPPHIGLWDDEIAKGHVAALGGSLYYFNYKLLQNGGESPWCDIDEASHYVVVARP